MSVVVYKYYCCSLIGQRNTSDSNQEGSVDRDETLRRKTKRSVSVPHYVETHIVADEALYRHYGGRKQTYSFMLGAMNMVSSPTNRGWMCDSQLQLIVTQLIPFLLFLGHFLCKLGDASSF